MAFRNLQLSIRVLDFVVTVKDGAIVSAKKIEKKSLPNRLEKKAIFFEFRPLQTQKFVCLNLRTHIKRENEKSR